MVFTKRVVLYFLRGFFVNEPIIFETSFSKSIYLLTCVRRITNFTIVVHHIMRWFARDAPMIREGVLERVSANSRQLTSYEVLNSSCRTVIKIVSEPL